MSIYLPVPGLKQRQHIVGVLMYVQTVRKLPIFTHPHETNEKKSSEAQQAWCASTEMLTLIAHTYMPLNQQSTEQTRIEKEEDIKGSPSI